MKNLNVCYTTNANYLVPMLVSLYSLLEHNPELNVCVYFIHEGLNEADWKKIDKVISQFSNCNLYDYEASQIYAFMDQYQIPTWRGTKIANTRLFLPQILHDNLESIVYLDSDTIVVGDLKTLAEQKQTEPIAAVRDHLSKIFWSQLCPELSHYYNSGVLKIDFPLWQQNHGEERLIQTIRKKYALRYPDQDILNIAFCDKIETLSPAYNLFPEDIYYDSFTLHHMYQKQQIDFYPKEEIQNAKENPIIFHAIDFHKVRPWQENTIHPFQGIYKEYLYKVLGEMPELEKSEVLFSNMNPRLFQILEYLRIYAPATVRKSIKKVLVKTKKI